MIYRFEIYGTHENNELTRFVDFVEKKYNELTSESIDIVFNGIVAVATLETKKRLPAEKLEKSRFLLENEFKKHFQKVRVIVTTK